MHTESDAALLYAWRDGDRVAGHNLFTRYYEPVARFFCNKVGESGGELIQQTFLAVVEGADRYRGDGSFRSYVFAIAYRQLCRHYRDRRPDNINLGSHSVLDLEPSITGLLVERDELRLLLAALRSLPLELQVVLELQHWEDCTVVEMALALELPEGTVKSRLRRGRERLRIALERLATTPEVAAHTWRGLDTWAKGIRDHVARRPTT